MNATLTNLTTNQQHGRPVAFAVLRNEAGEVIRPVDRLADQLLFAGKNSITIINSHEILLSLVLALGFAA